MTIRQLVHAVGDYTTLLIIDSYMGNTYYAASCIRFRNNISKYEYMLDWKVSSIDIGQGNYSAWLNVYVEVEY
jgi:hypothetical protein